MASISPNTNLEMSSERVVAFFRVREDAFRAISELKESGFTSDEIGLISKSDSVGTNKGPSGVLESAVNDRPLSTQFDTEGLRDENQTVFLEGGQEHSESIWDKLKHFFSGDSGDDVDHHDSTASLKWDKHRGEHYYQGISEGGAIVTVSGTRTEEAREILQDSGGDLREEGFENLESSENFAPRDLAFEDEGTDSALGGEEEFGEEEVVAEPADRQQDSRVQLRGEMLRNYRERTASRDPLSRDIATADNLTGNQERVIDPDGDLDLDVSGKDFKKPAA